MAVRLTKSGPGMRLQLGASLLEAAKEVDTRLVKDPPEAVRGGAHILEARRTRNAKAKVWQSALAALRGRARGRRRGRAGSVPDALQDPDAGEEHDEDAGDHHERAADPDADGHVERGVGDRNPVQR